MKRQQLLTLMIVVAALVGCAGEAAPAESSGEPTATPIPAPTAVEGEAAAQEADAPAMTDAPQEPE
ncbi:MAG: hypothetical protein P8Z40_05220, partial [Chloroflexota bacterium]